MKPFDTNTKVGILIILAFVVGVASTASLQEENYHRGQQSGWLIGATNQRDSMELDMNNGAVYQPNCTLQPSPFYADSQYIDCKGYWIYPTEEQIMLIRTGQELPFRTISLTKYDDFYYITNVGIKE